MADENDDVVVVGAGSAGAVIAARLSEEPQIRVALLEAGGPTDTIFHRAPMGMVAILPRAGKFNWGFETVPQLGLNGRRGYQPRGRGLGGSSAINAMAYVRGHRTDFDDWAAAGNAGWSFDEVLPYFRKAEGNRMHGAPLHGRDGPLMGKMCAATTLSRNASSTPVCGPACPSTPTSMAKSRTVSSASRSTRTAASAAPPRRPIWRQPPTLHNLRVITEAHATLILIEDGRAVGVEYERDGQRRVARARREVVLSAGGVPVAPAADGVGHR